MLNFQQSEATAERRRWIIVLVQDSDPTAGLTGATGQVYISKNGGTPALSTNSLVEVDSTNMPGHYYVELTAGELDTLGFISIVKKTAASKAFHDRGIVSYNDPYVSAGGFSGGTGGGATITKKQLEQLARFVWEFKFGEDTTAKDMLYKAAEDKPPVDLSGLESQIRAIVVPEVDLSPVIEAIESLPKPVNHKSDISKLATQISVLLNRPEIDVDNFSKSVKEFQLRTNDAVKDIRDSLAGVDMLKTGFSELQTLMEQFNAKASEAGDMDRRFENMTSVMQKQTLTEHKEAITALSSKIDSTLKKILLAFTDSKFEILRELNRK